MHPDHAGLAGWLTRRWNCALWMSAQEYLLCRALLSEVEREPPEDGVQFYRKAGLGERAPGVYRKRFGPYRIGFSALPQNYRRVRAGEALTIGASTWRVVMAPGIRRSMPVSGTSGAGCSSRGTRCCRASGPTSPCCRSSPARIP